MKSKDGDFRYQEFYSDSLMLPDKEKYELFLLEMIKSDNLCTDQKRNCLISLNRVVTKQSIDFLESLLSDSELSERAAMTLSLLTTWRRKRITEKLLSSDDQGQRYLGFTTLSDELYHSPERLAEFERDANGEIRSDVAWTYVNLKDYKNALKFENDSSLEAREAADFAFKGLSAIQELEWIRFSQELPKAISTLYLIEGAMVIRSGGYCFEHIPLSEIQGFCQVDSEKGSGLLVVQRREGQIISNLFILKLGRENYHPFEIKSWMHGVQGDFTKYTGIYPDQKVLEMNEDWINLEFGSLNSK